MPLIGKTHQLSSNINFNLDDRRDVFKAHSKS